MGWLFRAADVERSLLDRSNVKDLAQHAFYRWLEDTWVAHMLGRFFLTWVRVLLLLRQHTVLLPVYTCFVVLPGAGKNACHLVEQWSAWVQMLSGHMLCSRKAHPVA